MILSAWPQKSSGTQSISHPLVPLPVVNRVMERLCIMPSTSSAMMIMSAKTLVVFFTISEPSLFMKRTVLRMNPAAMALRAIQSSFRALSMPIRNSSFSSSGTLNGSVTTGEE